MIDRFGFQRLGLMCLKSGWRYAGGNKEGGRGGGNTSRLLDVVLSGYGFISFGG